MPMRKTKTAGIYSIENLVNKKIYIGQSVCIESRFSQHISSLRRQCHDNHNLQEDWNHYGESSFSFRLLEVCDKEELDEKESFYVEKFKSNEPEFGYNFTNGGKIGFKHNPELLKLESETQKKKYEDNPELRDKRKIDAIKQWSNPDERAKHCGTRNGMYGKTHSAEAREKIAQAQRGRVSHRRILVPVICVELDKYFYTAAEACKELGIKGSTNIYDVCKGKRKTCGGYTWKYAK